jgi:cysteinyl-tRNA synthetase
MLMLYDSYTGQKTEFHPLEDGVVRIYTCGPTVYDFAHIGNFRTFVFQDLLIRYLRFRGYQVLHVMNITDVDDKTIRNARERGMTLKDYTVQYTDAFMEDSRKLNIELPALLPRATDHIPEMVRLIRQLEDKGCTYRKDGSVYFSIGTFPPYGSLSKKDLSGVQAAGRVDSDEYEKKDDARDFVLWKARKEGEDYWDTELGPGRPGWHIECSAMSMKYLGSTLDMHCGGVDLIFPHHENEIAQSEAATGQKFVRYWVHSEFLLVEGEKMAKSKGNFHTLRDLLAAGHRPEAIRYLLLSVNYRRQLNFTTDGLHQAESSMRRLEDFVRIMSERPAQGGPGAGFAGVIEAARQKFVEAMDDDLNTSAALAVIFEFVRTVYQLDDRKQLPDADAHAAAGFIHEVDLVLGVLRKQQELLDDEIAKRIEQRQAARKARNFSEADRIRKELLALGILLEDTKDGVRWKRRQETGDRRQ